MPVNVYVCAHVCTFDVRGFLSDISNITLLPFLETGLSLFVEFTNQLGRMALKPMRSSRLNHSGIIPHFYRGSMWVIEFELTSSRIDSEHFTL